MRKTAMFEAGWHMLLKKLTVTIANKCPEISEIGGWSDKYLSTG
jgi:hypothetical protein